MSSQKFSEFGLSRQSAFGTKSTAPAVLILTDGRATLKEQQNAEDEKPYGGRIFMGASKLPYHSVASVPMRCYTQGNGLGECLLGLGDADTKSTPTGCTLGRKHRFEVSKTVVEEYLTIWAKSSQMERSVQDALLSKLTFNMPKGDMKLVAEFIGTLMAISSTFAASTADYVQPSDSPKKLHSSGIEIFKMGGLTSTVLTRMINGSLDFDNGIDAESGKFAGSEAVHDLEVGDLTIKGSFDFIATSDELQKFAWEGGEDTPDATGPSHVSNSFEFILGVFGKVIGAANRIDAAVAAAGNTGTNNPTASGTFTGSADALYELEISTAGTPDKFKWRKDGGAWSAEVTITGSAQVIAEGLSVTFSGTTGGVLGDHWDIQCLYLHGERMIEATNANPANTGTLTLTSGGAYVGLTDRLYEVEIDGVSSPNTFKWRKRAIGGDFGAWTAGVSITGSAQTLENGITVTFSGTTGGVAGDKWSFVVMEAKHGLLFRFPYCILDPADVGENSTRSQITLPFRVASPPMQTIGYIDLFNEYDTDYDA